MAGPTRPDAVLVQRWHLVSLTASEIAAGKPARHSESSLQLYCARTKKDSLQTASPQTKTWIEAWATLLESCLYSERAVTLFFTVISYAIRVFLNDRELVSGYLTSALGSSSSFALV